MGQEFKSETCFTCGTNHIQFYKISDSDGDSRFNIRHIICKHFWFKEDDLQNAIVCEPCWEKVDQFHQFYLDVENLHEHREVASQSLFIKQEEITIEETQLQESCIDVPAENGKLLDTSDSKHEIPEECDELPKKKKPAEDISQPRKRINSTKRLPKKGVVKRKKSHLLTPKQRKAEDDFIKQHSRYTCDECNIEFENFCTTKYHRIKTHKKDTVVCCGKQYRSRSILYQHVQKILNPEAFKCEICDKSFKFGNSYARHKEVNHAAEEKLVFKCNRCPKSFIEEGLLKRHMAEHDTLENETAKCEFCSKCFRTKNSLRMHVKVVHKKLKDFICEVCSKGFHIRGLFIEHQKTHKLTAEQLKEQCTVCNKWLKNHSTWLIHMRRHKKVECKCKVCDYVSTNIKSLQMHMKYKHAPDLKRHVCEQCGKEYSRAKTLKEHVAIAHTREHLYQCEYCKKKFFSSATMYSHRKKDHPQEWLKSQKARLEEISGGGEKAPKS